MYTLLFKNKFVKILLFFVAIVSYFSFSSSAQATLLDVPYTSQAPFGEWVDPRQQDGCEEASIFMAVSWIRKQQIDPSEARMQIIGMSDFQQHFFGYFKDSSAQDTANLMVNYFGYSNIDVQPNISVDNIKAAIDQNYLVIVPINPRVISTSLYNRATTKHTVVVIGYDNSTDEIIYHDPIAGPFRRTPATLFQQSLGDYASGNNILSTSRPSAMIIVAMVQ